MDQQAMMRSTYHGINTAHSLVYTVLAGLAYTSGPHYLVSNLLTISPDKTRSNTLVDIRRSISIH
jgi:hypothetical protein